MCYCTAVSINECVEPILRQISNQEKSLEYPFNLVLAVFDHLRDLPRLPFKRMYIYCWCTANFPIKTFEVITHAGNIL